MPAMSRIMSSFPMPCCISDGIRRHLQAICPLFGSKFDAKLRIWNYIPNFLGYFRIND